MKYMVEFTVSDPMFHDMIECKRVVEADSLRQAINEVYESSIRLHLKILGITNYFKLEE